MEYQYTIIEISENFWFSRTHYFKSFTKAAKFWLANRNRIDIGFPVHNPTESDDIMDMMALNDIYCQHSIN